MVDPDCEPEPIPVRIVRDAALAGVPATTLGQYLLRNGIIKDLPAPISGGFIEDFQVTFESNCVLAPLSRDEIDATNTIAAGNSVDVTIRGRANRIRVIRSLSWEISILGAVTPDEVSVLFDAQVSLFGGTHLFDTGPFPASDFVIGDPKSALTSHFRALLPIALLPGDQMIFRQNRAGGPFLLTSTVRTFEEEYLLPFRPPGL